MKRAYNKGAKPKIKKKVSNFEDHAENFYSDKTVHFYNMGSHGIYFIIVTLQLNRALFLILVVFWKRNEILQSIIIEKKSTIDQKPFFKAVNGRI
jgi:heme exporter protein D